MASNSEGSDVSRRLQEIESELRKIEKQSKISSEDQFFFAINFSLLILFLTLPMSDVMAFLKNSFALSDALAISTDNGIHVVGIVTALAASLVRYYGTMCSESVCKEKRWQSIIILFFGFWFFAFIIGANMLYGFSVTTWATIPLGIVILAFFYVAMAFLERRVLRFYASKGLIEKSKTAPVTSVSFIFLCVSYYFAFVCAILIITFLPSFEHILTPITAVSFTGVFLLLGRLYSKKLDLGRRTGRRRTPVQKELGD